MLNRRILRIKAMQALYAYELAISSLKEIWAEKVSKSFEYDPAFHDFTEKQEYDKRVRFVRRTFLDKIKDPSLDMANIDEDIVQAVANGYRGFQNAINSEHRSYRERMESEIKNIHHLYLKILLLPGEIAFLERKEKDRIGKKMAKSDAISNFNFGSNPVISTLTSFKPLVDLTIEEKVSWQGEEDQLKTWYKLWSKNDDIVAYQAKSSPTDEDHFTATKLLMKSLVFKTEEVDEYMSAADLHWSENKAILKSMVAKTIQGYEADLDPPFELKSLSLNEKDDFDYFKILFDKTIKEDLELEVTIAKRAKNWDMSRMASLDKIILKMALTEMTHFSSIPVKVTINEFIEISKKYSTPKSKQFVNGILDVLANELTSEGIIRKSGRGLIDNK